MAFETIFLPRPHRVLIVPGKAPPKSRRHLRRPNKADTAASHSACLSVWNALSAAPFQGPFLGTLFPVNSVRAFAMAVDLRTYRCDNLGLPPCFEAPLLVVGAFNALRNSNSTGSDEYCPDPQYASNIFYVVLQPGWLVGWMSSK